MIARDIDDRVRGKKLEERPHTYTVASFLLGFEARLLGNGSERDALRKRGDELRVEEMRKHREHVRRSLARKR